MTPKKKSTAGIVIGLLIALLAAFLAIHGSAAHTDVQNSEEDFTGLEAITAFSEALVFRLETPFVIEWNENSTMWLLATGFIFFIIVVQIMSAKRKTIAGKEHGTAKWSGQADIRDLFADTILKNEVKKIKMTRFFITRYFIRRKIFKECEKTGAKLKAEAIEDLKNSPWGNKEHKKIELKRINEESVAFVENAKMEAWPPFKMKTEYKNLVKKLNRKGGQLRNS